MFILFPPRRPGRLPPPAAVSQREGCGPQEGAPVLFRLALRASHLPQREGYGGADSRPSPWGEGAAGGGGRGRTSFRRRQRKRSESGLCNKNGAPGRAQRSGSAGERRSKGAAGGRPAEARTEADFAIKTGPPAEPSEAGLLGRGGARERREGDQRKPEREWTLLRRGTILRQKCDKSGTKLRQNRDEIYLSLCYTGIRPPTAHNSRRGGSPPPGPPDGRQRKPGFPPWADWGRMAGGTPGCFGCRYSPPGRRWVRRQVLPPVLR